MRVRLLVNLGVVLALMIVLIDAVVVVWMYRALTRERAEAFTRYALTLAATGASPTTLEEVASTGLAPILRLNLAKRVVWSSEPEMHGRSLAQLELLPRYDASPPPFGTRKAVFLSPISRQGRLVGFVGVVTDFGTVWGRVFRGHRPIMLYLLLDFIVVLIFGYYLLGRLLLRPLARLNQAVSRLDLGDPLLAAASSGGDEITSLGHAIGRMSRQLNSDKQRIATQLEELKSAHTQLEEAQQELVQRERLAVAGRLAAGIAHDIGNPLGIVQGYLTLLVGASAEQVPVLIEKCERELERINSFIRSLLELGRPLALELLPTDMAAFLEETLTRMRTMPRMAEIELKLKVEPGLPKIALDRPRMERVIANLLVNAADALRGEPNQAGVVEIAVSATGDGILLVISDNGPGVPEQLRERVLQAFVSTKPEVEGTGLGLSTARQIVELHGGSICIAEAPGGGASVEIFIPG